MVCLLDVVRAFKRFDSLKEFMKIFLISFQKLQENSLIRPSFPGDLLFSIRFKDS